MGGVGSKGGVTVPLRATLTHRGGPSFSGLSMGYHEMMGGGDGGEEGSSAAMTTNRQNGVVREDVRYGVGLWKGRDRWEGGRRRRGTGM